MSRFVRRGEATAATEVEKGNSNARRSLATVAEAKLRTESMSQEIRKLVVKSQSHPLSASRRIAQTGQAQREKEGLEWG